MTVVCFFFSNEPPTQKKKKEAFKINVSQWCVYAQFCWTSSVAVSLVRTSSKKKKHVHFVLSCVGDLDTVCGVNCIGATSRDVWKSRSSVTKTQRLLRSPKIKPVDLSSLDSSLASFCNSPRFAGTVLPASSTERVQQRMDVRGQGHGSGRAS